MNVAQTMNAEQRKYDKLHHMARVNWLSQPNPVWVDGSAVRKHETLSLLQSSESALKLIGEGMSVRSVDLSDVEYLAELDVFAASLN